MQTITINLLGTIFLRVPSSRVAVIAIVVVVTSARLFGQNFTARCSLDEFSNVIIEQADTAMVIQPGVPADAPYVDELVTGDEM